MLTASLFSSPWPQRIIRLLTGLVFIYAGGAKLMDPKSFARSVSAYDLVPEVLLPVVALGLPAIEVIAGIGIIFNIAGSLTAIFCMLVLFVFVLWYGILKDLNIDCGCFSQKELEEHDGLRSAFHRDLVLMAGVVYVYVWRYFQSSRKSIFQKSVQIHKEDNYV